MAMATGKQHSRIRLSTPWFKELLSVAHALEVASWDGATHDSNGEHKETTAQWVMLGPPKDAEGNVIKDRQSLLPL